MRLLHGRHKGGGGGKLRTLAIGSSEHRQGMLQQRIAAITILVAKPAWWQAESRSRFTGRQYPAVLLAVLGRVGGKWGEGNARRTKNQPPQGAAAAGSPEQVVAEEGVAAHAGLAAATAQVQPPHSATLAVCSRGMCEGRGNEA